MKLAKLSLQLLSCCNLTIILFLRHVNNMRSDPLGRWNGLDYSGEYDNMMGHAVMLTQTNIQTNKV